MTLTIICPKSEKYRQPLIQALNFVGINDYQILDPAHDEIRREFCLVLYIGELSADRFKKLQDISQKAWNLGVPDATATAPVKKAWLQALEAVRDKILDMRDKEQFKKADVPPLLELADYLNSKVGQIVEVQLPDRRRVGIYPDSQRLKGEHDIEYHASTIVNIAKLFELFDGPEIIIKEI